MRNVAGSPEPLKVTELSDWVHSNSKAWWQQALVNPSKEVWSVWWETSTLCPPDLSIWSRGLHKGSVLALFKRTYLREPE